MNRVFLHVDRPVYSHQGMAIALRHCAVQPEEKVGPCSQMLENLRESAIKCFIVRVGFLKDWNDFMGLFVFLYPLVSYTLPR
jgi:hypothetical protein